MCLLNEKTITRRKFIRLVTQGTAAYFTGQFLTPINNNLAYAAGYGDERKVIIVVNLAGGASYCVAPPTHGAFRDRHPNTFPANPLNISSNQALHPSFTNLKSLWDAHDMTIVNMCGLPNNSRSHDVATENLFRGLVESASGSSGGWGARLTCNMRSVYSGISFSGGNTLIKGTCNPPRALLGLEGLGLRRWNSDPFTDWLAITEQNLRADSAPASGQNQSHVKEAQDRLALSLQTLKNKASLNVGVNFPNTSFGRACLDAARLINSPELKNRFIFLQQGGFDTHSGQVSRLNSLLSDVDNSLGALVQAIKLAGRWNDVIIITQTEFSRTFENGSSGSDHGHAFPMFIMGGSVRGGSLVNSTPTVNETQANNYYQYHRVDARAVYWNIIRDFLKMDPSPVFPENFEKINLGLV
ncbi:MAG: DUF1501 domain-containing protein [Bdellovibrionales bacterium]|nr:DUF1501 domain-containing protein [Bdellovibrionales bacterium]